jgi:hypothetical protein
VIGIRNTCSDTKFLFDAGTRTTVSNINGYLVDGPDLTVSASNTSLFNLPKMYRGSAATDGGHLIFSEQEAASVQIQFPEIRTYLRKFLGSKEVVRGEVRYCLWISDDDLPLAREIEPIAERLALVAKFRQDSKNPVTQPAAQTPHRFWFVSGEAVHSSILVPRVTSERRPYLPVAMVGADVISSDLNQVLYDAPEWCVALIASRLHLVWIATVCGKLKSDFRYSNTLGWNTFPVPKFSDDQLAQLSASARRILKTRYQHYPATIADLYDPDKMPDDLRQAHRDNDDLLETMYIGRPFRNDTERLEKLFKLYAMRVKQGGK